jgi:hypothetical protein
MKISNLYDCFERHLFDLNIASETDECFLNQVVENFLINLGGLGYDFTGHAEDTFLELRDEVSDMLKKKIYGHVSVDHYRDVARSKSSTTSFGSQKLSFSADEEK